MLSSQIVNVFSFHHAASHFWPVSWPSAESVNEFVTVGVMACPRWRFRRRCPGHPGSAIAVAIAPFSGLFRSPISAAAVPCFTPPCRLHPRSRWKDIRQGHHHGKWWQAVLADGCCAESDSTAAVRYPRRSSALRFRDHSILLSLWLTGWLIWVVVSIRSQAAVIQTPEVLI